MTRGMVFQISQELGINMRYINREIEADTEAFRTAYPRLFHWLCRTPLFLIDGMRAIEVFFDYLEENGIGSEGTALSGEIEDFPGLAEYLEEHEVQKQHFMGFFNSIAITYLESWQYFFEMPKEIGRFVESGIFFPNTQSLQLFMDSMGIPAMTNLVKVFCPQVEGGSEFGNAQLYLKTQLPKGCLDIEMTMFGELPQAEIDALLVGWCNDVPGFESAQVTFSLMEEE